MTKNVVSRMRIKNIFRVNDWKISEFFIFVYSVQFALLGLTLLGVLGYEVPLIRPVVGFIYLTFVPGALLLGYSKYIRRRARSPSCTWQGSA